MGGSLATHEEHQHGAVECWLSLHRTMVTGREVDRVELDFVRRGLAFFHVSGAGHEVTALLARHLCETDWLHLHYRDKALLLARGLPIEEIFASLLCRSGSHSEGRQMSAHFSSPRLNLLSQTGPVGNHALQAVGVAAALRDRHENGIVVCSTGDGTTQQGEFLEAIAEAVRSRLPVLFLVEDNHLAISTRTAGKTFWDLPDRRVDEFYGLPILRLDSSDVRAVDRVFGEVVERIRSDRSPAIVVLDVQRLSDHSNADDQDQYRDLYEVVEALATADPIRRLEDYLVECGICPNELRQIRAEIAVDVEAVAARALALPEPVACRTTKAPLPRVMIERTEYTGLGNVKTFTMREALNAALWHRLSSDERVFLYGQDIEDSKGDVFGVTRGLSRRFPDRVVNAPLSEATIVGACIGRALAGQRPVAFIQFADFLPLAYNQIASELASIYWRTGGGWQCPVIVMVTCGGYKPGLGPFHSQTLESIAAHTPGIDVVMPSSAGDAAGLLNAAFESGRPTIFFYPKSCLNLADRATSADVMHQFVPLGSAHRVRDGNDLTLVTWGNTIEQCRQAAESLAEAGISADLFDLRSLSPWDEAAVIASAERTRRLVVVHEDNHSCGFGAEVAATVAEKAAKPVKIRRVTRPDTFVPCHFGNQLDILPSYRGVVAAAADLLGLRLAWQEPVDDDTGTYTIDAIGSGPADESVIVTEVKVATGDRVRLGEVVAEVEASKAAVDISSMVEGIVQEVLVSPGCTISVGAPLVRVSTSDTLRKPVTQERRAIPIFSGQGSAESVGNALRGLRGVPTAAGASVSPVSPLRSGNRRGVGRDLALPSEEDRGCAGGAAFDVTSRMTPTNHTGIPLTERQRQLNQRLRQSSNVPTGTISQPLHWQRLVETTAAFRASHPGTAITEFDVVAYAVTRAAKLHPRFRSTLAADDSLEESPHVDLGIAVHLPGDDLSLAVIRGADLLPLRNFAVTLEDEILAAMNGAESQHSGVRLVLTYLGGLPATDAVPLLVAPATGVLFIGAPYPTPEGLRAKLCLTFDHRVVNGVGAARFLAEITRQIERLAMHESNGHIDLRSRGWLAGSLRSAAPSDRTTAAERTVADLVAKLVSVPAAGNGAPTTPRTFSVEEPLRHLGLTSLGAVELAEHLSRAIGHYLPQTLAWSYPTIAAIAAYLLDLLALANGEAPQVPPLTPAEGRGGSGSGQFDADLLAKIERLTPTEAAELLALYRAGGWPSQAVPNLERSE